MFYVIFLTNQVVALLCVYSPHAYVVFDVISNISFDIQQPQLVRKAGSCEIYLFLFDLLGIPMPIHSGKYSGMYSDQHSNTHYVS